MYSEVLDEMEMEPEMEPEVEPIIIAADEDEKIVLYAKDTKEGFGFFVDEILVIGASCAMKSAFVTILTGDNEKTSLKTLCIFADGIEFDYQLIRRTASSDREVTRLDETKRFKYGPSEQRFVLGAAIVSEKDTEDVREEYTLIFDADVVSLCVAFGNEETLRLKKAV